MNVSQIKTRLRQRLDDDETYWKPAEYLAAINEAQIVFAFLTLCLEKTSTLSLTATKTFYRTRAYFNDYLLPLRVKIGTARVLPARIEELDALNVAWQATAGTPAQYVHLGFSFLAITPQPALGTSMDITFAHEPAVLTLDTQVPEIPEAHHEALVDYGMAYLRAPEGGQAIQSCVESFGRFWQEAVSTARYVRARSLASKYDKLPAELELIDQSRAFKGLMQDRGKVARPQPMEVQA